MRRIEVVAEDEELPELARVVSAADVKAYADAGGDQNPLHQDDAFARSVGFDGIIAHGMFTMAHMTAAVVSWTGDPAAVIRVAAQFRAPVFMGDEIVAGGHVVSVEGNVVTLQTWVRVERHGRAEWPIKRAEVTIDLGR
jgi:acyl dehydratase